jgi:hypothetical protein
MEDRLIENVLRAKEAKELREHHDGQKVLKDRTCGVAAPYDKLQPVTHCK